jgi:hypothetical protein
MLSLVSASGLQVVNQSINSTTKIVGQPLTFTIDILNSELFSFYNISVEDNPYIHFETIPSLLSGQTARVTVNLTSDLAFNSTFKILGYYPAQIGASNQTYNINVDYYNGLSQCDLTIIKGDTVIWNNSVLDNIVMRNSVTNLDVTTILDGDYYKTIFDTPYSLSYFFLRRGYPFTNVCTITALSDSGNVNDPSKDANFTLGVNIIYTPTNILSTFLITNYTINVFDSTDGVMSIKNIGSNIAKNVHLSNSWFTFSSNDFDLLPGVTKAITYTISPLISVTNDTNKEYTQNLTISGNFASLNYPFTIFVPYMNLENANQTSNYGSLLDLIAQYCNEHPSESFCSNQSKIVYVYSNGSNIVTMNWTQDQLKGLFDFVFQNGDNLVALSDYVKEHFDGWNSTIGNISVRLDNLETDNQNQNTTLATTASTQMFIFISVAILLLSALVGSIIFITKREKKKREVKRF